jgi:heme oxygenase
MLIEKIRASTGKEHQQLEGTLLPYINQISSREEYSLLLQAFHGYVLPVQEKIMLFIDNGVVPDIAQRRNADLLQKDLLELGQEANADYCTDLPPISSHAEALGALYVLEGSTLGGKIISKMISGKLNSPAGLQFFNGYGDKTGSMWKAFLVSLGQNGHPDHNGIIVESVRKTFSLFDKWLKEKLDTNDGKYPTAS